MAGSLHAYHHAYGCYSRTRWDKGSDNVKAANTCALAGSPGPTRLWSKSLVCISDEHVHQALTAPRCIHSTKRTHWLNRGESMKLGQRKHGVDVFLKVPDTSQWACALNMRKYTTISDHTQNHETNPNYIYISANLWSWNTLSHLCFIHPVRPNPLIDGCFWKFCIKCVWSPLSVLFSLVEPPPPQSPVGLHAADHSGLTDFSLVLLVCFIHLKKGANLWKAPVTVGSCYHKNSNLVLSESETFVRPLRMSSFR